MYHLFSTVAFVICLLLMLATQIKNLESGDDESEQQKQLDLLTFVEKTIQETSKIIDNELTPKKPKNERKRPKTHTRHIINNMNRNGMNCYPYMKCYQKVSPTYGRHSSNLKCYMDESVKALFLNENDDDCTYRIRKLEKKSLRNLRKKAIKRNKRHYETTRATGHPRNEKPHRSKSPSTIPLDTKFDDPIISNVLDDLIMKGSFNSEFEDLFCSTFTSSQTL